MEKFNIEYDGKLYFEYTKEEAERVNIPVGIIDAAYQEWKVQKTQSSRLQAYRRESDSLYLEWQYDQTPEKEQAWRDKVAEIKARYPLG